MREQEVKKAVASPGVSDKCGLYTNFVKEFEAKLNAVSLVQIVTTATSAELDASVSDALAFLSPLLGEGTAGTTVVTDEAEAHVLLLSHVARLSLRASDTPASKKNVEKARELVEASHEMDPVVHSAFYNAAAEYHKVVGTASEFFRNALQFLAYTPPESLPLPVQHQWAFDIGIAALVGDDIYNFGEVLSHTIILSLAGTEHEWLLLLLKAFNSGNLEQFDAVCKQSAKQMNDQAVLVAHEEFLRQKVTILALMELAFSRALENTISFKDVEKACRLPSKEVEYLLMRSMSLGLISGVIDNVDQVISITRVQPRVLDREPVGHMAKRLSAWCANVDKTLEFVGQQTVSLTD